MQKKEQEKIDFENRKLMAKIISSESSVNFKELTDSYEKVKQFKMRQSIKSNRVGIA